MSLRDVWVPLNSRTPLFGSLVGHTDCPPGGVSVQATLEVIAGLTELCAPQTQNYDICRYKACATNTWFAIFFFPNAKIFDLPSCTIQEYIQVNGIDPLVAPLACILSLFTAVLTHGLLLFYRVPIHRRWYKALKSRVVQVKYEKKGVTLLWIQVPTYIQR